MIRPLYIIGSQVLQRPARETDGAPGIEAVKHLLQDLTDTMIAAGGIGLAAPQIGVSLRVAIVALEKGTILNLINPIFDWKGTEFQMAAEMCLSIPNREILVSRPSKVSLGGTIYTGLDARCIQHEIDHLNGILITDYTSEDRRTARDRRSQVR